GRRLAGRVRRERDQVRAALRVGTFACIAALAAGLATAPAAAVTPPSSSAGGAAGDIKPAAERSITAGPAQRPIGRGVVSEGGSSGQPAIRGPKIPEALRKQLQARLDARIAADIVQTKQLRMEGIALLQKFVAETPREAAEMPEALVRLAELQWENERES